MISENIPVIVYSSLPDERSTKVLVSGRVDGLTGYGAREFLDDPDLWKSMVHPDDRERVRQEIHAHRRSRSTLDIEYRITRKDGVLVWIRDASTPVIDDKGDLVQIDGFMEDITERKRSEDALKAERSKLKAYFDNLPLCAYNIGFDGTILDCNSMAVRTLGHNCPEDLIGKPLISTVYAPSSRAKAKALLAKWKRDGKLVNEELQIITRDGDVLDVLLNVDTIFDHNGAAQHSLSTHLDITERKGAERALRESEERYRALMENIPVGLYRNTPGPRGGFLMANPAIARMFGYDTADEFLQSSVAELYRDPDDRRAFSDKLLAQGQVTAEELRLKKKDGTPIWGAVTASLVTNASGEVRHFDGMIEDITERKRAEDALRESEERFRTIFENGPVMIDAFDENGQCVLWNNECEKAFGWTMEEINSHETPLAVFYPDPEVRKQVAESVTSEPEGVFREWHPLTKEGSERITLWANFQLPDGVIINLGHDITERRHAEDALRESEERFRNLMKYVPGVSIHGYRPDGTVIHWNKASEEVYGYTAQEAQGRNLGDLIIPGDLRPLFNKSLEVGKRLETSGEFMPPGELMLLHKQGHLVPVYSIHTAACVKGKEPVLFCIDVDLSERKRAEEALREGERRFRSLFDHMLDGFAYHQIVTDEQGRPVDYVFLEINDSFERLTGIKRSDAIGRRVTEVLPGIENSHFDWIATYGKVALTGRPIRFEQYSESLDRWYAVSAYRPAPAHFACVFEDVTNRRRDHEEIRMLGTVTEQVTDSIIVTDTDYRITYINHAAEELFGWRLEEILGKTPAIFNAEANVDEIQAEIYEALESGRSYAGSWPNERKDGSAFICEFNVSHMRDEDGRVTGYVGIQRDVTERQRAREALRESRQRLLKAQHVAGMGFLDWHIKTGDMYWSDEVYRMYGIDPKEIRPDIDLTTQLVHPDDLEFVQENLEMAIRGEKPYDIDHRHLRSDGQVIWVHAQAELTCDAEGNPETLLGTVVDITERKRAEEALSASKERLQAVLDNSPTVVYLKDAEGRYILINRQYEILFHVTKDDVVGKTDHDLFPADTADAFRANDRAVLEADAPLEFQEDVTQDDGPHSYVSAKFPLPDATGQTYAVCGISTDITERKRAEEEIARLAKFPEENPSPVLRVSGEGALLFANTPSSPLLAAWHCAVGGPLPDLWRRRVAEALSSGQTRQIEAECGARIFSLTLAPVPDADYVNVYGRDVTERRLALEALKESEEWFRSVFEGSRDAILITDGDARLVDVNEAACALTGYSREELTQMSVSELADPMDFDALKACFARIMVGEAIERELVIRRKDGATIQTELSSRKALIRDVPHMHAVVRDITARKKLRDELNSFFDVASDMMCVASPTEGRLTKVNPACLRMLGRSAEELCSRPFEDFIHPDDRESTRNTVAKQLEGNPVADFENRYEHKDGSYRWLSWMATRAIDGQIFAVARDITDRKRTESRLRLLGTVTEQVTDSIVVTDADYRITYINHAAEELFGWKLEELLGKTPAIFNAEPNVDEIQAEVHEALESGRSYAGSWPNERKDGSAFICEFNVSHMRDEDGRVTGYMGIQRDVTERQRTQEALLYRAEFDRIITTLSSGFVHVATDEVDTAIERALGAIGEFAEVDRSYVFLLREDGRTVDNTHEWCADGIEPQIANLKAIPLDEELPWFAARIRRIEDVYIPSVAAMEPGAALEQEHFQIQGIQSLVVVPMVSGGALMGFLGFDSVASEKQWSEDIVALLRIVGEVFVNALARNRAEAAERASREDLRALTRQLGKAEEIERQHLSRELHDQVGQHLTAMGINLGFVRGQLPADTPAAAEAGLADAMVQLDEVAERIRDLMADLRPPVLDDYGVGAALRAHAHRFAKRTGLTVRVTGDALVPRLSPDAETALYRIALEALTNVAKHAHAETVSIGFDVKQQRISLSIADDGVGFDPAAPKSRDKGRGWGMITMRERAIAVGAELRVEAQPGQGTRIIVSLKRGG